MKEIWTFLPATLRLWQDATTLKLSSRDLNSTRAMFFSALCFKILTAEGQLKGENILVSPSTVHVSLFMPETWRVREGALIVIDLAAVKLNKGRSTGRKIGRSREFKNTDPREGGR